MFYKNTQKNKFRGFTLVEVLVSLSIFSLVMLIATGSIFTIVDANKKIHSLKSVMTNLNFALESISREIRVGNGFVCPSTGGDCLSGGTGFRFISNRDLDSVGGNDPVEYTFSNGRIYKQRFGVDTSPVPVTAEEVVITYMRFYVIGSSAGDLKQPRVVMTISGDVGTGKNKSTFNIQTAISQRSIDS
jgi:prepilin-type N-terminal cleavage/methylation domain-containing protein